MKSEVQGVSINLTFIPVEHDVYDVTKTNSETNDFPLKFIIKITYLN